MSSLGRCIEYAVYYALATLRLLFLRRQDVIVLLTTPPFIAWAALLHRLLHPKTRLVLWNMDCYPEVAEAAGVIKLGGIVSRTLRGLNTFLLRRIDTVICLDHAMQQQMSKYGNSQCPVPTTVIPTWDTLFTTDVTPPTGQFPDTRTPDSNSTRERVPASKFPRLRVELPSTWEDSEMSEFESSQDEEGSTNRPFVVLYSGNMGRCHRFETVIDAAGQLSNQQVEFVFNGGGSEKSGLGREVSQRCLSNVRFSEYSPREQYLQLLASADCALITLRDEMVGLVSPSKLNAALAVGLPIIYVGPQGSNVDEAIQQFSCGVSVRHGDSDAIVRFIGELRADARRHAQFRANALEAYRTAHAPKQALSRFDAVIDGEPEVLRIPEVVAELSKAA
jgi:glycosyltransferase involved in cell wall biosynthesis